MQVTIEKEFAVAFSNHFSRPLIFIDKCLDSKCDGWYLDATSLEIVRDALPYFVPAVLPAPPENKIIGTAKMSVKIDYVDEVKLRVNKL